MALNFPKILSALLPSRKKSLIGDEAAATLVTYFLLVLLVHALTTQTVLQTPGLLKANRHL